MVSQHDAALPLAGYICVMASKPLERWRTLPQFTAPLLAYSMWFGKAAEVFVLRQAALGFVWWPRGF